MSSDEDNVFEGTMHFQRSTSRMARGPSVYDAQHFTREPGSPSHHHRRDENDLVDANETHEPFGFDDDRGQIMFDYDDDGATPTAATQIPFPTHASDGPPAFESDRATLGDEGIAPLITPIVSLPSAVPSALRRGLGMRDIVSASSHLWLMHQHLGGPVRVRTFPGGLVDFNHYCQRAEIAVPQYVHHAWGGSGDASRKKRRHRGGTDESKSNSTYGSTPSLSSSTNSSKTVDRVSQTYWLDLQTDNATEIQAFLNLFNLANTSIECVLEQHPVDHVEHYPSLGYVFVNIACHAPAANESVARGGTSRRMGKLRTNASFTSLSSGRSSHTCDDANIFEDDSAQIIVSCIVFQDWIVTIHKSPFAELGDLVKQVHIDFTLKKKAKVRRHETPASGGLTLTSPENVPGTSPDHEAESPAVLLRRIMRPAWVLSTLVDFVVSNFLPDPTPLLGVVDEVEAQVMLLANASSRQQQVALARRIALLRRAITTHRRIVNSKEQLLTQLLLPAMRTTFIAKRSVDADVYVYCQRQTAKVAERIDAARDMLQSANSNFAAAGQLRMARASQALELRMHVMSSITVVLSPPALVAGLWGMNVSVPFMSSQGHDSVRAFWVVVGVIAIWLAVLVKPLISRYRAASVSAVDRVTWDADAFIGKRGRSKH